MICFSPVGSSSRLLYVERSSPNRQSLTHNSNNALSKHEQKGGKKNYLHSFLLWQKLIPNRNRNIWCCCHCCHYCWWWCCYCCAVLHRNREPKKDKPINQSASQSTAIRHTYLKKNSKIKRDEHVSCSNTNVHAPLKFLAAKERRDRLERRRTKKTTTDNEQNLYKIL